ncbi:MAG: sugar phosphate isomerase/epimerase [Ruminococcaceae bacterium]|nr:sugar phosphate isomerase/epimerase [Oscillospiraceae bacterium]
MNNNFTISGFSDEISENINEQFEHLTKLGIKHFEIRGVNGKNISELTEEEAQEVKKLADSYGISVSSIGSPIGKIKIDEPFEPHLELLAHVIKLAKIFDTKYIRVFSFWVPQNEDATKYRDEVIVRMKKMCALAEKEDIILLHENEKKIYGDIASRCKDVLDSVNSPNLKAVFDPANFVECNQQTYPEAYELLKDYVVYIHIKDATDLGKVVPAGMGLGKIPELLSRFKNDGYNGFLSLEPHLNLFTGLASLQDDTTAIENKLNGPDAFTLAYNSLNKVLETI